MKERLLTCIVCPRGCALTVRLDESGKPLSVSGNACKRGEAYAACAEAKADDQNRCSGQMRDVCRSRKARAGLL